METIQVTKISRSYKFTRRINILAIIDLLENTTCEIRFERLRMASKIKHKASFLNYVKYCIDKELLTNRKVLGRKVFGTRESWFLITEKGRVFLELLQ